MTRRISNERCFWIRNPLADELPWSEHEFNLFGSGREAIVALIWALELKPHDCALLPAYVPEGIIAPFRIQNIDVKLYPLDGNLDPVWDTIALLLNEYRPRIAIMIHFYGVTRDIQRFVSLCHSHNTLVIQDLAHIHPLKEKKLGLSADFVLYSLTKIIGVPDGAILQVNTGNSLQLKRRRSLNPVRFLYLVMNMVQLCLITISRRSGSARFWSFFWRFFGRFLNSYRLLMWYFRRPARISSCSAWLLRNFPWRESALKRIRFENLYHDALDRKIFKHLSLPGNDHCSMGYPVLVDQRESLVEWLGRHGIYGIWFDYKWDWFPDEKVHDEARWVMQHHFLFPTAYALNDFEVLHVIKIANQWASMQNNY